MYETGSGNGIGWLATFLSVRRKNKTNSATVLMNCSFRACIKFMRLHHGNIIVRLEYHWCHWWSIYWCVHHHQNHFGVRLASDCSHHPLVLPMSLFVVFDFD